MAFRAVVIIPNFPPRPQRKALVVGRNAPFYAMNYLVKPRKRHLLVFIALVSPIIAAAVTFLRFLWLFNSIVLLFAAVVALLLSYFVAAGIDQRKGWATRKYVSAVAAVSFIFLAVSIPVGIALRHYSERRAVSIVNAVESFKSRTGFYPDSLGIAGKGLPRRSFLGTKYFYSVYQGDYLLSFRALDGDQAYYAPQAKRWTYRD
ncbi:MAG: hypothetical protein EOP04_10385 [Proteobacteria bacterium]|nr:MAG: hypothetical protein EOP04_10385 [Pseudomonadota bacterium]